MSWTNDYIRIPFKEKGRTRDGCDCWGLLRIVAADRGVELPEFSNGYDKSSDDLHTAVGLHKANPVDIGAEQPFDVLMFTNKLHVGIVVTPGRMLHCHVGTGTVIEDYRNVIWERRLKAIARLPLSH